MSHSASTFLIGVDGGGTGCRVAVGTLSDGIIAKADGGRANAATDPERAIASVISATRNAAAQASVPEHLLTEAVAHVGLAGVMTPADSARIAAALPFKKCIVTDDRPTAVRGALGCHDGFLLSVGTGTIAASCVAGDVSFVGGWGFHLADKGSGAWLAHASLERVLLCHDKIADHTDLTRSLFAKFGGDPNAIVSFSMTAKPGDYGTFAPEIISAALTGDAWGMSVMKRGAEHFVRYLDALKFQPGDTLCLAGGVGPYYETFLPTEHLTGRVSSRGTALDGAFQLAQKAASETREGVL
ncbi:hypothetical protein KX928_04385 [Roseobacter sp. YSTF-M11]|uniref:ATPase BadF/BadG/BcrA/BcrD type domain-containing protein n=1 Tax=Roseobacter insulae TaxID=2859783 RepID=A0A9X1FT01_9RHOB|nr:BadF/BadG/BcrA/BcrD ATPase family protein [Roseobacter insulae]MBW4707021.1 hypothetical protein [Roseobacter insulae]